MSKSPKEDAGVELRPDGWERFERAVDAGVKGGPKHRTAKPKTRPVSKGRVHKGKTRT
jgi:hypothetical protein